MDKISTFIYQDAKRNITIQSISKISENEVYLQGFCTIANGFRTYRKDRILEIIENEKISEERLEYYRSINPPPLSPSQSSRKPSHLLDICFTGFKSDDKKRLKELSENAGFVIRSTVSKNLNFLCCGYNAGPKKIEKAREQGAVAITEEQLIKLIETGEIPD